MINKILTILTLIFVITSCDLHPKEQKQENTINAVFKNITEPAPKSSAMEQNTKPLKVAVMLPLTGSYQNIGFESLEVLQMATNDFGDKLSLVPFDSNENFNDFATLSESLKEDGFNVIIGPIFNFETLALAESEQSIPIISLSNDKTINKPNVIVFGSNQDEKIASAVSFFVGRGKMNFITLLPNSNNGSRIYRDIKASIEANSANLMRAEFYDDTGIADVSKFIYKVLGGLKQNIYTSNETEEVLTEREIRIMQEKNPNLQLDDLYVKDTKVAEVIFISSLSQLESITEILKEPKNQKRLEGVEIFFIDGGELNDNLNLFEGGYIYSDYSSEALEFKRKFNEIYEKNPTKISGFLYDAIFYSIYVNNNTFGTPKLNDFKNKYRGFVGINGAFYIDDTNSVKRAGRIIKVINGELINLSY